MKVKLYFYVSELLEFCKHIALTYDRELLERCHLSRKTLTSIVQDCIGACSTEKLSEELEMSPCSLLINGSTEFYGEKYLAILVRYIASDEDQSTTKLLSIVELGSEITEVIADVLREKLFKIKDLAMTRRKEKSSAIIFF